MSRCHIVSFCCFFFYNPDTCGCGLSLGTSTFVFQWFMQRRLKAWMDTPWRWWEVRSVCLVSHCCWFFLSLLGLQVFGSYISMRMAASQKQPQGFSFLSFLSVAFRGRIKKEGRFPPWFSKVNLNESQTIVQLHRLDSLPALSLPPAALGRVHHGFQHLQE